jgi:putative holliday junction resolvase
MRMLALDWGESRIGAAVSDPSQTIATPLKTPLNPKTALKEIKEICEIFEVSKIILGIPLSLKGKKTDSTIKAEVFKDKLAKSTGLPVKTVDERLSTKEAEKMLSGQGMNEKKQRRDKDNLSAQLMLQQYLEGLRKQ